MRSFKLHISAINVGPHESLDSTFDVSANKTIVFAGNGCGKTFISRMFRLQQSTEELSDRFIRNGENSGQFVFEQISEDTNRNYKVDLKRGLSPVITQDTPFIFHVFNSEYVKEQLEPRRYALSGDIEGFYVGKENIDLEADKIALAQIAEEEKSIRAEIEQSIKLGKETLKQEGVRGNLTEFKKIDFQTIVQTDIPSESNYDKALTSLRELSDLDPESIRLTYSSFAVDTMLLDSISSLLETSYDRSTFSDEFLDHVRKHSDFIRMGIDAIHEKEDVCPFCGQSLSLDAQNLILRYEQYLSDEESKVLEKAKGLINSVKSLNAQYNSWAVNYTTFILEFTKLQTVIPSLGMEALPKKLDPDGIKTLIHDVVQSLDRKTKNISETVSSAAVKSLKSALDTAKQLSQDARMLHSKADAAIRKVDNEKSKARKALCNAMFKKLQIENQKLIESHKEKTDEWLQAKSNLDQKREGVSQPLREVVAAQFGKLINAFFGEKYDFDEESFSILFAGGPVSGNVDEVLSDGEQSIIAFCHYLANTPALIKEPSDWDRVYFIIDDPINSLDYSYVYVLAQMLRNLKDIGSPNGELNQTRYLLMTHNAEFFNIVAKNSIASNRWMLSQNGINHAKYSVIMPYDEYLQEIYEIARNGMSPTSKTGHAIRHVLEAAWHVHSPNKHNFENFVSDIPELSSVPYIYTLAQDQSHGLFRTTPPVDDELLRRACEATVTLIERIFPGQITNLASSSGTFTQSN